MRFGHFFGVHGEALVDAGDDVIEERERLVVEIERAVGQDVAFGEAKKMRKPSLANLRLEEFDFSGLETDAFLVEAIGLVLDLLWSAIPRYSRPKSSAACAMASTVSMPSLHVEWQPKAPRRFDSSMSFGNFSGAGGFNFTHVLAQLGLDVIEQLERLVEVLLGFALDGTAQFLRAFLLPPGGREGRIH